MSIEVIGMAGTEEVSESRGSLDGPQVDAGYLARFAQAHAAERAAIAKLTGTWAAIKAVEQAVALVGNNGLTRKYPLGGTIRTCCALGCTRSRTTRSLPRPTGRPSQESPRRSRNATIGGQLWSR